jgi:hypothetical protein
MMESTRGWDWWAFWIQLAATLIGFLLGVPYGIFLLWMQRRSESKSRTANYAAVARAVMTDLEAIKSKLLEWQPLLVNGESLPSGVIGPLTWDALGEAVLMFIERGTFAKTQAAASFYQRSLDLSQGWNRELASGGRLSEATKGAVILQIEATLQRLEAAMESIRASLSSPENQK